MSYERLRCFVSDLLGRVIVMSAGDSPLIWWVFRMRCQPSPVSHLRMDVCLGGAKCRSGRLSQRAPPTARRNQVHVQEKATGPFSMGSPASSPPLSRGVMRKEQCPRAVLYIEDNHGARHDRRPLMGPAAFRHPP